MGNNVNDQVGNNGNVDSTVLIAAGADIKTTQTRLGHANPQTTLRLYARASPDADRLAEDAAGSMMRKRPAPKVRPKRGVRPNGES